MEAWHSMRKYKKLTELSAQVGAELRSMKGPEAQELYKETQARESKAVNAGAAYDSASREVAERRGANDRSRRALRILVEAGVAIGRVVGLEGVEAFAAFDRGDDVALAGRLEDTVRGHPGVGSDLTNLLAKMGREVVASQRALEKSLETQTEAERELASVVFGLEGLVSQGRALLIAKGVRVAHRKPRKAKRAEADTAAASIADGTVKPPALPATIVPIQLTGTLIPVAA